MANTNRILLVDDDPNLLRLLSIRLQSAGYTIKTAKNGKQALALLKAYRPQLLITDLRMDGIDGIALFKQVQADYPTLPVIILTAYGSIPEAVTATQEGVFSFLTKPFDSHVLMEQIEKAIQLNGGDIADEFVEEWHSEIITCSPRMQELLNRAKLIAASDAAVFINGPSGSGKELLARAIHNASSRADKPFVAINCGAIPEALLESELFGHRKGAFTGAVNDHIGLFQSANGGTLLLDEIGDMPLVLQVKLLRVLQEKRVRPVGATKDVEVDVRIISATHKNPEKEMQAGRFREDFYYRLNVVALTLPALAERREDIPLLVDHFSKQINTQNDKPVPTLTREALELLVNAPWPGNIRQLINVIEQLVTLATGPVITESQVRIALNDQAKSVPSLAEARQDFDRDYLAQLMRMTQGNVSQAAYLAQRNRTEFYKLLNRYDLDPELFRVNN